MVNFVVNWVVIFQGCFGIFVVVEFIVVNARDNLMVNFRVVSPPCTRLVCIGNYRVTNPP